MGSSQLVSFLHGHHNVFTRSSQREMIPRLPYKQETDGRTLQLVTVRLEMSSWKTISFVPASYFTSKMLSVVVGNTSSRLIFSDRRLAKLTSRTPRSSDIHFAIWESLFFWHSVETIACSSALSYSPNEPE